MTPNVLVVGAGPVGLAAALEIQRHGGRVRLIDKRLEPTTESRAIGINPRTLELLEPTGVTERLLAAGVRLRGARIFAGGRVWAQIDLTRIRHRYNFLLALPQSDTERILSEAVAAEGVSVERGVELTAAAIDEAGVTAQFAGPHGGAKRYDWLVGADGAHSVVRKAIGADFPGERYPFGWSLADLELGGDVEEDRADMHIDAGRPILVRLPLGRGRHRLISNDPDVLGRMPSSWTPGTVDWQSRFSVSHRLADRIVRGRAVIIGDAAHIHSPAGGRGMNLGIEDAATLAPRLVAGDLGTWAKERRAQAAVVVRESDRLQRFATSQSPLKALLPPLLSLAMRVPALHGRLVRGAVGFAAG